jgi:hypothetical protein
MLDVFEGLARNRRLNLTLAFNHVFSGSLR